MKVKYLIIFSLILAIITVGAVSASENVTGDDLAVEDSIEVVDDFISEEDDSMPIDDAPLTASDEVPTGEGSDLRAEVYSGGRLYQSHNPVVNLYTTNPQEGNVSIYVDGDIRFNQTVPVSKYAFTHYNGDYVCQIMSDQLGIDSAGDYTIEVYFNNVKLATGEYKMIEYYFELYWYSSYYSLGDVIDFRINLPSDVTGTVTFTAHGKTYRVYKINDEYVLDVNTKDWNLGDNLVVVSLTGDDKYTDGRIERNVTLEPGVHIPYALSIGENDPIVINAPGLSGKLELTIYNSDNFDLVQSHNITVTNGYGSYLISDVPRGYYNIEIKGQLGDYYIDRYSQIRIDLNNHHYHASISQSEIAPGEYVNLEITGQTDAVLSFFVDGQWIKDVSLKFGKCIEQFSGLSIGTHTIKVMSYSGPFYSNNFIITVKEKAPVKKDVIKLTLGKVKVKKSAKKLVIKATLKINGKAKKGLKVKFKFNKKSYTAKTNAKGVAKITVKKSVLKKLKVGKKLTYKATYGKTVKKVTVKVKK